MKLPKVLGKNLRLLLRSKGSAFTVLLAPILMVLIVGFSFLSTGDPVVGIGVVENGTQSNITARYIETLNTSESNLLEYDSRIACELGIGRGDVVACVIIPEVNLEDDDIENITFVVDDSRENIAERLSNRFLGRVGSESTEVRGEIVGDVLGVLEQVRANAQSMEESLSKAETNIGNLRESYSTINEESQSLNTETVEIDIGEVEARFDDYSQEFVALRSSADDVDDVTRTYIENQSTGNQSAKDAAVAELNDLRTDVQIAQNSTAQVQFFAALENVEEQLSVVEERLKAAGSYKGEVQSQIEDATTALETIESRVKQAKLQAQSTKDVVNDLGYTTTESIANPVETKIETVSSGTTKVLYSFPYLFSTVLMFFSVLLAGMLVYMEKTSRASFRKFTLPLRTSYTVTTTFITAFIIVLFQSVLILGLTDAYFGLAVMSNIAVTSALVVLGAALFISLGMFLGSLFTTSEGLTLGSIGISSVLLFMSNFIVPLEALSNTIQSISAYNPFVILSEALRRSLVFQASFDVLQTDFLLLGGLVIGVFGLSMATQKLRDERILAERLMYHGRPVVHGKEELSAHKHPSEVLRFVENLSKDEWKSYRDAVQTWLDEHGLVDLHHKKQKKTVGNLREHVDEESE